MTASELLKLPLRDAAAHIAAMLKEGGNPMTLLNGEQLTEKELARYEELWRGTAEKLAAEARALRRYARVKRAGITAVLTGGAADD